MRDRLVYCKRRLIDGLLKRSLTIATIILCFCLWGDITSCIAEHCPPLPPYNSSGGAVITVGPKQASSLPAIVRDVKANTAILLEDGIYVVHGLIHINKPYVVLRSKSGKRDAVVIDGEYKGYLIKVTAPNVVIADLTLKRAKKHLVHLSGGAHHALLHNLRLIDARQQFVKVNPERGDFADFGTLACSSFELTKDGRKHVDPIFGGCYTGGFDAISVQGWTVRDNHFENIYCTNGGLPTHMVLFWKASRGSIVERNTIVNCARGIGFGMGSAGGQRVYADDPTAGLTTQPGHIGGIIRNNVIYGNIGRYFDTGISLEQAWNAQVYYNTIYSSGGTFSSIDSRFQSSNPIIKNNLIWPPMTNRAGAKPVCQANVEAKEEMFVNVGNGDLHLVKGARKVIDRGETLKQLVIDDIDGELRDLRPDIGADEFKQK